MKKIVLMAVLMGFAGCNDVPYDDTQNKKEVG